MENTAPKRTPRFRRPGSSTLPTRPTLSNVDTKPPTQLPAVDRQSMSIGLPSLASKAPAEIVQEGYVSSLAAPQSQKSPVAHVAPKRVDNKLPLAPRMSTPTPVKAKPMAPVAPKTKKAEVKAPKKTGLQVGRITETDKLIIRKCYEYGQLTLSHLARAIGSISDNQRVRVSALVKAGYLGIVRNPVMNRYYAKRLGLDLVGISNGKVYDNVAESTVAHTNQLNSTLIALSLGDAVNNELARREVERANKDIAARNIRWEGDNELLAMKQQQLRQQGSLTVAEQAILRRKPKSFTSYVPDAQPNVLIAEDSNRQPTLSERTIRIHEQDRGDALCLLDWAADIKKWFDNDSYPRWSEANQDKEMSETVYQAINQQVAGFANGNYGYIFKHWNDQQTIYGLQGEELFTTHNNFGRRHSFDGIILRPNIVYNNGESIRGGCWAIEQELSKKSALDYKRIILQAKDHPLINRLYYFVADNQIRFRIEQGKKLAITEMVYADTTSNKSHQQKLAEATAFMDSFLRISDRTLINARHNESGYCG